MKRLIQQLKTRFVSLEIQNLKRMRLPLAGLVMALLIFQACEKEMIEDNSLDMQARANVKAVTTELVADGFVSPIGVVAAPDDSGRLFVIDQAGTAWTIESNGEVSEEPYLDVRPNMVSLTPGYDERGLLGLAFHPNFESNGRLFAYYTAPPISGEFNNTSRISEFTATSADAGQVSLGTERIILEVNQPQSNHEGGTIAFGPDGYLYISIGDGGGADDVGDGHVEDWYEFNEGGNGQDIEQNLLGNILRIDIDNGTPYGIPADNPFIDHNGLDEIYAYGFRNPYRFSFDMSATNDLYVGDAGQNLWEEISVVEKGGNYGWNVKEGTHCFNAGDGPDPVDCPDVDVSGNKLIDPVIEMPNEFGVTVTIIGGNVYRGNHIPGLNGKYIFGSFSNNFGPTGEIFVANPAGPGLWPFQEIEVGGKDDLGVYLKGFGQDLEGEIYLTTSDSLGPDGNTGEILKLVLAENKGGQKKINLPLTQRKTAGKWPIRFPRRIL